MNVNLAKITTVAVRSVSHPLAATRDPLSILYKGLPVGARRSPPCLPRFHVHCWRTMSSTAALEAKFAPAKRVAGQKQDVWSIVNEAAAASPVQPIVNMGQGFL